MNIKYYDIRLKLFLEEILNDNEVNIILNSNLRYEDLFSNPESLSTNLSMLNDETKENLFIYINAFKKNKITYKNNLINFVKFRILDIPIVIILSFLIFFQLQNLIYQIQDFYQLKPPKTEIIYLGCIIISYLFYIPLKTFYENNLKKYFILLTMYILILFFSTFIPTLGIYCCLLTFSIAVYFNILFFKKQ